MELVDYEIEKQLFFNVIEESMLMIIDIDNEINDLESQNLLKKILVQKKYIRQLNRFKNAGKELYKKRAGFYSFYSCDMIFDYSIKQGKIKYPGKRYWVKIVSKTLDKIINNDLETIEKLSLR